VRGLGRYKERKLGSLDQWVQLKTLRHYRRSDDPRPREKNLGHEKELVWGHWRGRIRANKKNFIGTE